VDINVYGFKDVAQIVGKRLSKAPIYLQHPHRLDDNIEYDNPHYFRAPGQPTPRPGTVMTMICPEKPMQLASRSPDISTVFDSLTRHRFLQQVKEDSRIRTPLLR
jgi:hypothetical protein